MKLVLNVILCFMQLTTAQLQEKLCQMGNLSEDVSAQQLEKGNSLGDILLNSSNCQYKCQQQAQVSGGRLLVEMVDNIIVIIIVVMAVVVVRGVMVDAQMHMYANTRAQAHTQTHVQTRTKIFIFNFHIFKYR